MTQQASCAFGSMSEAHGAMEQAEALRARLGDLKIPIDYPERGTRIEI